MASEVTISKEALRALYNVWDTWWNKIGTFEGPEDSEYCLLSLEDDQLMQNAAEEVEKFIPEIQSLVD